MNWDVLDRNLRLGSEGKGLGNGVGCFRAKGEKIRWGQIGAEYKCLEVCKNDQHLCKGRRIESTSMRDHLLVQVLQPLKKLIHNILSLGFAYLSSRPRSVVNIREKVSASTQLEKYVTSSNYNQT